MTPTAAITGWGLLTCLGPDVGSTYQALLAGRFIAKHSRVPDVEARTLPRVTPLALAAARQAAAASGWGPQALGDVETAIVVGTSKGPVEGWLAPLTPAATAAERPPAGSFAFGLSETASALAAALGCGPGPRLTVTGACASGLHALVRGAMLVSSGEARRALVIAVESSLHPLFTASFQRLGVLARPGFGCRPFDVSREGFLVSEAAAAIAIEALDPPCPMGASAAARDGTAAPGVRERVLIDRFALGGDPSHLTGNDPESRALRSLLRRVIDGRPVDLVHAHGTGTVANDPVELAAIEATVIPGEEPPSVYSHKGALGHSLGASGLVSVVLNCEAHGRGVVPPNVQTTTPLPAERVRIERGGVERPVRRSVAIAAGFGGAMAAVSLVGGGGPLREVPPRAG
jgi:3-oxoacyl-[acyl-carrier-protein] synthase II